MSTKVTIQDIADALGLSRNTVSKAINNTGVLAESTRQKVLEKALDVYGGYSASGTNVWQYTANDTNAQKWKFVKTSAPGSKTAKPKINSL